MGKIVAIGGGEIHLKETLAIDKFIVEFAEVKSPKLLFIPTASKDSKNYVQSVTKIYQELGCQVDSLELINESETEETIKAKILDSHIIYVGGGNTYQMMEIWKQNKVDQYLKLAYEQNSVLCGLSAGSICWFVNGHSDSKSYMSETWNYIKVDGLGLINAFHCPHFDDPLRISSYLEFMKSEPIGIAIEDRAALVIKDDYYKIIKDDSEKKIYMFKNNNMNIERVELKNISFKKREFF